MYCCEKLNNRRIKFDFYTTLLRLNFYMVLFTSLLIFICVMAAGSFMVRPSVFPVIPAESRIPSLRTGFT